MHKKNKTSQLLCVWCLNPLYHDATLFDLFFMRNLFCYTCYSSLHKKHQTYAVGPLECESMVVYTQEIERVLYRFKEDHDLPLASAFFYPARNYFKKKKDCVFVLMPSSNAKNKERGFYTLEEMIKNYTNRYVTPLKKTSNIKQSTQSRSQRKNIKQTIVLDDIQCIQGKHVILVDDVCTTGNTLLSAYSLIAPHALKVQAFTFAVSSWLIDKE